MRDVPIDLLPIEEAVFHFMPALGLTALRWGQVEGTTVRLLAQLANVPRELQIPLALHIPDRTALDIILSMSRVYDFSAELKAAIKHYADWHEIARENRNLIIHGNLFPSEPGIEPVVFCIQKISARGEAKMLNLKIDLDEIYRVAQNCRELATYGNSLVLHLQHLAPKKAPPELPQLPPLPRRLAVHLPRLELHDLLRRRKFGQGYAAWGDLTEVEDDQQSPKTE